jgi:hypothetical protein
MITLTAKINLLSGDNDKLTLGSTDLSGSNISSDLGAIVGVRKTCLNPFIFGVSKFGSGATFESKQSFSSRSGGGYYIGNQPSDENGNIIPPTTFTIIGNAMTSLTIAFDTANGRHPKSVWIDGVEYIDDDAIFTVANFTSATSHTITISNWNTANAPIVITGIYVEVSIEIDRKNLISIDRSIFDRSDLKLPSFGIISNTGNIEFNDLNGEIRDYAEQLLLQSGLACEIRLNNTLVGGATELVATMETDQWDYDNDNRVVSVSLKDDLEEWQDINVAEISYDPRVVESKPFSWLYEHLWKLTSNRSSYVNDKGETVIAKGNYNMLSINELDKDTKTVLNNTYIQYPLLESGSLWQQWTKLCQACQLHIYKNNDGVVVCRYNGGN